MELTEEEQASVAGGKNSVCAKANKESGRETDNPEDSKIVFYLGVDHNLVIR